MQRAIAYVILVTVAVIALSVFTTFLPSPAAALRLTVSTDKGFYTAGEPVRVALHLTNAGTTTVELTFGSSCQASFTVQDFQGNPVYDFSRVRACLMMITHLRLLPGASQAYEFTWDQTTVSGAPAPGGEWYRVVGSVSAGLPIASSSATFYVTP